MSQSIDLAALIGLLMPAREPAAPQFDAEAIGAATAAQIAALSCKLKGIAQGVVTVADREVLLDQAFALDRLFPRFQSGLYQGAIVRSDREKVLCADASTAITSAVSAASQTRQWQAAMRTVSLATADHKRPDVSLYVVQPQD